MKRTKFVNIVILIVAGLMSITFFQAMNWTFSELIQFSLGITLLWGPASLFLYFLLETEIVDRMARFTFSVIASYTLTTLVFMFLSELHLDFVFYVSQVVIVVFCVRWAYRRKPWQVLGAMISNNFSRYSMLIFILAGSLVTSIEYDRAFYTSPTNGGETYLQSPDVLFAVGQSYQLAREIPLLQSPIRAGTPDRAYHFLSHITTMLIARYTGQGDMLRAQMGYHYMIIAILIVLAIFSIVKTLTKSRWAAYMAVALLYIITMIYPPLVSTTFPWFYFTVFPNVINGLDYATAEPQMYSGIVVMYGGLLGFLLISQRANRSEPCRVLLLTTGLIIAAALRFRIHFGIVMLPGFLLLVTLMGLRKRQWFYFFAVGVSFVIALLLYLETKLPTYLPETTSISLAYNGLTAPGSQFAAFYNNWPGANDIYQWLQQHIADPDILKWVWQYVDLSGCALLSVVGIPLLLATFIFILGKAARRKLGWFSLFLVWVTIATIGVAGAMTLISDPFSLAGQIPFHLRWYLFPLMGVALWMFYRFGEKTLYRYFEKRYLYWPKQFLRAFGFVLIIGFIGAHPNLPNNTVTFFHPNNGIAFSSDERALFAYLHDQTPSDAVIMNRLYLGQYAFPISALAGRIAWIEAPYNLYDSYAQSIYPDDKRFDSVQAIWQAPDSPTFCRLLLKTSTTYVINFSFQPFTVHAPTCMRLVWTSQNQIGFIWQVIR